MQIFHTEATATPVTCRRLPKDNAAAFKVAQSLIRGSDLVQIDHPYESFQLTSGRDWLGDSYIDITYKGTTLGEFKPLARLEQVDKLWEGNRFYTATLFAEAPSFAGFGYSSEESPFTFSESIFLNNYFSDGPIKALIRLFNGTCEGRVLI